MARRSEPIRKSAADSEIVDPIAKLASILAIYVTRDMQPDDAALRLDKLGFSAKEIAGVLGVNNNYINVIKSRKAKNR